MCLQSGFRYQHPAQTEHILVCIRNWCQKLHSGTSFLTSVMGIRRLREVWQQQRSPEQKKSLHHNLTEISAITSRSISAHFELTLCFSPFCSTLVMTLSRVFISTLVRCQTTTAFTQVNQIIKNIRSIKGNGEKLD